MHSRFIAGVLFLCQNLIMEEYIIRFCNLGMSISEAFSAYCETMSKGGLHYVETYLSELERNRRCG